MSKKTHIKNVITEDNNVNKLDKLALAAIIKQIRTNPLFD